VIAFRPLQAEHDVHAACESTRAAPVLGPT
jgi:hypothetical protein